MCCQQKTDEVCNREILRESTVTCSEAVLEQYGVCCWVSGVEQNSDCFRMVLKQKQIMDRVMPECKHSNLAVANSMLAFMPARVTIWHFIRV